MSEYEIPFHIQEEIMTRLPVKSLVRFRSVSKTWKSLIDSFEFTAAHSLRCHTQQQHLLVSHVDVSQEEGHVLFCQSYIDDDTFPQQSSVPALPPPLCAQHFVRSVVVGCSHGLVCLNGFHASLNTNMTLLWNPSIRKVVVVATPTIENGLGFGVCPMTNDPKIVSIKQSPWGVAGTSYRCEVMVYTLSSGKWRSLSTNLPTKRIRDWCSIVNTDRFIYWDVESPTCNMIMSFNLISESFEVIDLPHSLACHAPCALHITKLRESLAILQSDRNTHTIWLVEDAVQRSFTKIFTINTTYIILGFRKSGVPIVQVRDDEDGQDKLVVFEPKSQHNNVLVSDGIPFFFNVHSYMETLLLLGRSDCISY